MRLDISFYCGHYKALVQGDLPGVQGESPEDQG
jgi:hypothetical protein